MPIELLFSESFTETPFSPARTIETTMSRKLLAEGHTKAKLIEPIDPEENQVVPSEVSTTPGKSFSIPDEIGPAVRCWLPPCITAVSDVHGSFQLYGHLKQDVNLLKQMKTYFSSTCDIEDHPEDYKDNWMPKEACLSKLEWYHAQVCTSG